MRALGADISADDASAEIKRLQRETNERLKRGGVVFYDENSAFIAVDAEIGAGTVIYPHVVIEERVTVGENCRIGPFAYIRPDSVIGSDVKVGDFVEVKNSAVGDGTKISHLTYVGDSDVGKAVNFGCGTTTANYDGKRKYRTKIGDGAFLGCNTNLVAPVEVGDGAYTAAGSTITRDVPPRTLAIARSTQVIKDKWRDKRHV